jgi:glycine cleavage system regulatory protein
MHEVPKQKFEVTPTPTYRARFKLEGANEPGLVFKLADLFRQHTLRIEQLSSETATAPMGGTTLFVLDGVVECDSAVDKTRLHQEVDELADKLNMDITLTDVTPPDQEMLEVKFDTTESGQKATMSH